MDGRHARRIAPRMLIHSYGGPVFRDPYGDAARSLEGDRHRKGNSALGKTGAWIRCWWWRQLRKSGSCISSTRPASSGVQRLMERPCLARRATPAPAAAGCCVRPPARSRAGRSQRFVRSAGSRRCWGPVWAAWPVGHRVLPCVSPGRLHAWPHRCGRTTQARCLCRAARRARALRSPTCRPAVISRVSFSARLFLMASRSAASFVSSQERSWWRVLPLYPSLPSMAREPPGNARCARGWCCPGRCGWSSHRRRPA